MKRDGGRSMNRLFRDILRENKNDYIRTVLGCSWIISLIYFSTAVGGCLSYISTGSIPQMTYLIIEVEKEFLIPYGLLLMGGGFLMIAGGILLLWFLVWICATAIPWIIAKIREFWNRNFGRGCE